MTMIEKAKSYRIFKIETVDEFYDGAEKFDDKLLARNDYTKEQIEDWNKCDFIITEKCDKYYNFPISKEELEQLGNELIELARGVKK